MLIVNLMFFKTWRFGFSINVPQMKVHGLVTIGITIFQMYFFQLALIVFKIVFKINRCLRTSIYFEYDGALGCTRIDRLRSVYRVRFLTNATAY